MLGRSIEMTVETFIRASRATLSLTARPAFCSRSAFVEGSILVKCGISHATSRRYSSLIMTSSPIRRLSAGASEMTVAMPAPTSAEASEASPDLSVTSTTGRPRCASVRAMATAPGGPSFSPPSRLPVALSTTEKPVRIRDALRVLAPGRCLPVEVEHLLEMGDRRPDLHAVVGESRDLVDAARFAQRRQPGQGVDLVRDRRGNVVRKPAYPFARLAQPRSRPAA